MKGVISDNKNPKDAKTEFLQQRKLNFVQKRMQSTFMSS